ncbi:MAG: hypothetical protein D6820_05645 [Lentisphaerae bacterium]|nr:MAG: hypothetical protein D6820_05645 [Lentisphaerota bacterium]
MPRAMIGMFMCCLFMPLYAKEFKIIAVSDPAQTTHYLKSGTFTLGITDNGGGVINYLALPGVGDIMDVEADKYGRAGQIAIRDRAHGGVYNPTQSGFNETLGTQCEIIQVPDMLIVKPRPMALWHGDGKYDFTEWENIGPDPYKNDGGHKDQDGLDESNLPGKQATEVFSEFDYFGIYQNLYGKFGLKTPVIRHYLEIRFIRPPGHCLKQFRDGTRRFNAKALSPDISERFPQGSFPGTASDLNGFIAVWSLRHDLAKWDAQVVYYRKSDGTWNMMKAEKKFRRGPQRLTEPDNTAVIVADSSDPNRGRALGLYRPRSDINTFFMIGRNEQTGKIVYRDTRCKRPAHGTKLLYHYKRIPTMSKYGFLTLAEGMINRTRLPEHVYEAFRSEYFILSGTPKEIQAAIRQIDTVLTEIDRTLDSLIARYGQ